MSYGYIIKNMLTKVIMSLIICCIVAYIGYNFAPIDYTLTTFIVYLLGIGNSFIGIDTLNAAKKEDNFIGNLSPFLTAMILTALNVLIFYILGSVILSLIFGLNFVLPYDYYGITTNVWIGAYAIITIVWNSYMDLKFYE